MACPPQNCQGYRKNENLKNVLVLRILKRHDNYMQGKNLQLDLETVKDIREKILMKYTQNLGFRWK